jgi:hypothetical protein
MVYGETFLRNFKFYAKILTKLHDLTVINKILPFNFFLCGIFITFSSQERSGYTYTVPVPYKWDF